LHPRFSPRATERVARRLASAWSTNREPWWPASSRRGPPRRRAVPSTPVAVVLTAALLAVAIAVAVVIAGPLLAVATAVAPPIAVTVTVTVAVTVAVAIAIAVIVAITITVMLRGVVGGWGREPPAPSERDGEAKASTRS
jgi:hypothetical protein